MIENARMDMQLSKEQLHTVTGGCSRCAPLVKRAQEYELQGLEYQKKAGCSATLQEAEAHMKQAQGWYALAKKESRAALERHDGSTRPLPTTTS